MAMKRFCKIATENRQKGSALFDAMIATLLVMIMGLGPMYVIVKAQAAQRTGGSQQWVTSELRNLLLRNPHNEMCDASGNAIGVWANPQTFTRTGLVTGGGTAPSVSVVVTALCYPAGTLTVNGVSVVRSTVTLVGCAGSPLGGMGPIIIREGDVANNEPTSCDNS